MSYKSILLLLDDGKSNADRVKTAITIAKTHNAHLTAVALESLKSQYMITTNVLKKQKSLSSHLNLLQKHRVLVKH